MGRKYFHVRELDKIHEQRWSVYYSFSVSSFLGSGHRQPPLTHWLPPHGPPQRLLPLPVSPQRSTVSSSSQGPLREAEDSPWLESQTPCSGLRTAPPVSLPPGAECSAAVPHGASSLIPLAVSTVPHHALSLSQQMPFPPVTLNLRDSKAALSVSAPPRAPARALLHSSATPCRVPAVSPAPLTSPQRINVTTPSSSERTVSRAFSLVALTPNPANVSLPVFPKEHPALLSSFPPSLGCTPAALSMLLD